MYPPPLFPRPPPHQVLFPDSYASTASWLRGLMDPAEDALFAAQQQLLAALDRHPAFDRLAGGLVVREGAGAGVAVAAAAAVTVTP